ncbi:ABC transporter permease [Roseomonas sp. HF4]|uniref:ABC transporter permease n=1 Tax=Roseomonas sp. HF4 TaxID=2562313 RepID=UPI0010BFAA29|nr:ABC transporter permease [Roseomonas sp. HF4]
MNRVALAYLLGLGGLLAMMVAIAPTGGIQALPMSRAFLPPGAAHPFGTDDLGRDMLLAVAQGARTSLLVGLVALGLGGGIGVAAGLAAGLGPVVLDEALMRTTDVVASLPTLLIAVLAAAFFGGSAMLVALVLGLTRWPVIARLVRAETLTLRRLPFFRAAVALGCGPLRLGRRHVLPQLAAVVAPAAGVIFGGAILAEATLAFLGLGDPELTSWGRLIAAGYPFLDDAWWMWAFPVAAICLTTALVALASDAIGRSD